MQLNDISRIKWIDFVRVVGICCVVLCHAVEDGIYILKLDNMLSVRFCSRVFAFSCFTFGRLGVPLCLLINASSITTKRARNRQKRAKMI